MSKTLAAANLTEIAASALRKVAFVSMDFSSGILYVHSAIGDITWGGETWLGVGDLGNIDSIRSTPDIRPQPVRLTLSGVDSAMVTTAMTEDYHGRTVEIYTGFVDESGDLVADPELDWSGRMDHMSMEIGENTATLMLACESRFADWNIPKLSRWTNEEQQERFTGDTFFEYLDQMRDLVLEWGGARQSPGLAKDHKLPERDHFELPT